MIGTEGRYQNISIKSNGEDKMYSYKMMWKQWYFNNCNDILQGEFTSMLR